MSRGSMGQLLSKERGAKDDSSTGSALTSSVPPHGGCTELAAGKRVRWQSQTFQGTNQVQGPTRELRQEQKETGPKTSNNEGPKSFLETGLKKNLKTSTLTAEPGGPWAALWVEAAGEACQGH